MRGGGVNQAKTILRSVRSRDECFLRAREGEVQVWVQVWIWPHALPKLGRLARCQVGRYPAHVREEGDGSVAVRLGQEGADSETTVRGEQTQPELMPARTRVGTLGQA